VSEPIIDVHLTDDFFERSLEKDVTTGLGNEPKTLPPKWFYDAEGSRLFERITALDEYYQTRTEASILGDHAAEFAELTKASTLVELGSGSSEKTRLLLDSLVDKGTLTEFVPLDVSISALREASAKIAIDYHDVRVHGVVGDFTAHLDRLPGTAPRAVAFLGGTVGNLLPAERARFFRGLAETLRQGEWLLLGTDLVKDPAVLVPAYDDAAGVTAEFNRNVLRVLNRECGADFDVEAFDHRAVWDAENEWIEMHLVASRAMKVRVAKFDMDLEFGAGEAMRTEISAKFRRDGITAELADAGFTVERFWTDPAEQFAVTLARRI
jgi:L-histidine N-alpha-methyltransferase